MRQLRHSTTAAFLRKAIYETGRRKDEEKKKRKATRTKGSKEEEEEEEGAKSSNLIMNKKFEECKKSHDFGWGPPFRFIIVGVTTTELFAAKKGRVERDFIYHSGKNVRTVVVEKKNRMFFSCCCCCQTDHHREETTTSSTAGRKEEISKTYLLLTGFLFRLLFSCLLCVCVPFYVVVSSHFQQQFPAAQDGMKQEKISLFPLFSWWSFQALKNWRLFFADSSDFFSLWWKTEGRMTPNSTTTSHTGENNNNNNTRRDVTISNSLHWLTRTKRRRRRRDQK